MLHLAAVQGPRSFWTSATAAVEERSNEALSRPPPKPDDRPTNEMSFSQVLVRTKAQIRKRTMQIAKVIAILVSTYNIGKQRRKI